jgi:REP element-mobilizing transposase RayT
MARPLRLFVPEGIYFITGRCLQARFLMRPSVAVNNIVGGVLARAMGSFDVEVFAFVFASNHFHMLVRSRSGVIPAFMQYLRSNVAKKLGRRVDWHGKFWDRRYDAAPVLDDDALVGRLRYILAHGVKEGLVARCASWPGLTSIPEILGSGPREFVWPAGIGSGDACKWATRVALELAPLPCWEGLTTARRGELVIEMMQEIETEAGGKRQSTPVLGVRKVLAQRPHAKPRSAERTRRPLCHASTQVARDHYAATYRAFADAYAAASAAYRGGDQSVEFPAYAYRPPWVVPRMLAA